MSKSTEVLEKEVRVSFGIRKVTHCVTQVGDLKRELQELRQQLAAEASARPEPNRKGTISQVAIGLDIGGQSYFAVNKGN